MALLNIYCDAGIFPTFKVLSNWLNDDLENLGPQNARFLNEAQVTIYLDDDVEISELVNFINKVDGLATDFSITHNTPDADSPLRPNSVVSYRLDRDSNYNYIAARHVQKSHLQVQEEQEIYKRTTQQLTHEAITPIAAIRDAYRSLCRSLEVICLDYLEKYPKPVNGLFGTGHKSQENALDILMKAITDFRYGRELFDVLNPIRESHLKPYHMDYILKAYGGDWEVSRPYIIPSYNNMLEAYQRLKQYALANSRNGELHDNIVNAIQTLEHNFEGIFSPNLHALIFENESHTVTSNTRPG